MSGNTLLSPLLNLNVWDIGMTSGARVLIMSELLLNSESVRARPPVRRLFPFESVPPGDKLWSLSLILSCPEVVVVLINGIVVTVLHVPKSVLPFVCLVVDVSWGLVHYHPRLCRTYCSYLVNASLSITESYASTKGGFVGSKNGGCYFYNPSCSLSCSVLLWI